MWLKIQNIMDINMDLLQLFINVLLKKAASLGNKSTFSGTLTFYRQYLRCRFSTNAIDR